MEGDEETDTDDVQEPAGVLVNVGDEDDDILRKYDGRVVILILGDAEADDDAETDKLVEVDGEYSHAEDRPNDGRPVSDVVGVCAAEIIAEAVGVVIDDIETSGDTDATGLTVFNPDTVIDTDTLRLVMADGDRLEIAEAVCIAVAVVSVVALGLGDSD